ncbi:chitinase-3-like protein 1 [Varanus komodoensis]|uniref:Chitinase-3-like protein 1 n=1 Tax=Varanus komodoensis TaxID=61221 RepID=A0A8D2L0E2_VARKO|nr:chitinase-3-like protein 1 [Varanus komodoensis]
MGQPSLLVGGVAALLFLQCASTFKLVCYFTNWAQYRESSARFIPDDIDPGLCTHIIYAFAKIEGNRITHTEWNDVTTYMNIHALKRRNPSLKTLISLGGYGPGSEAYRSVTTDPTRRLEFVRSVVQFLRTHKFDGFDLAWHSSDETTKRRLSDLVQDLCIAFQREARRNPGTAKPILSVAIPAGKEVLDNGFDIQHISKFADFFNFMTYDFHAYLESHRYTGHVSPLYKGRVDTGASSSYNVDEAVKYFKTKGAPPEKIIMGVPTYGRSFTLSSMLTGVGAPASGPGTPGPFTKTEGSLAYYEICSFNYGAKTERIEEQAVPYSHKGNQWVGYEDKISLQSKVRYMKNNHLGGIMVWTLDMDDFSGFFCRDGKYPLLRAIKEELNK